MPTNDEAFDAIHRMFQAPDQGIVTDLRGNEIVGWPTLQPTISYTFSNAEFVPPQDQPWVKLSIIGTDSEQVEFGNSRRFRRIAIVRVQFWLVAGAGAGLAASFADSIRSIYEGRTVESIRFGPTSPAIEERAEGSWFRWRCDTGFDFDELRAL